MSVRGFSPGKELWQPRGEWSFLAQKRKGTPLRAAFMQNMRVNPGVVKSRPGTSVVFATSGNVTTIFNWIEPLIGQPGVWQGAPTGTNNLLVGHIDVPNGSSEYIFPVVPTGIATFFGWSIAGPVNTTASVTLAIDGVNLGAATIGIPRPDVADAAPGNAGSPNFGWSLDIDITPYVSGIPHSVVITVTDTAANTVVATSTFFVTRPATGAENLVLYQDGAVIKRYRQSDGDIAIVFTEAFAARAITFEPINNALYMAGYDVFDQGTMQVEIYDGTTTTKAFRPPISFLSADVTVTDAGPGQCTLGTHVFGFVYQNRTGFLGPPSVYLGTGGYIASITLASDQRTIDVTVELDAQIDGGGTATLFLIMTRADNPNNWFYVPTDPVTGSIGDLPVPANMATTLHFVASISDEDLAASADPANDQFLVMSQSSDGGGPFSPNFVVSYGTRMCYGVGVQVFVSDENGPQQLTADQHVVRMPSQRQIAYAFPLSGSTNLFLTGEGWTSYVTDNGDVPSTWAPPVTSSASLGAPFPACVCFRTRGSYAWIVTDGGVYLFNGEFSEKPVTYLVSDQWARVNWKASYAVTIVDDVPALRCYVAVPLDGATEPTHMFCIDYTNGLSFDQVDISLDVFSFGQFSSVGVVREIATDMTNLWVGSVAIQGGKSIVRLDTATHNDLGGSEGLALFPLLSSNGSTGTFSNTGSSDAAPWYVCAITAPAGVEISGNFPVTIVTDGTTYGPFATNVHFGDNTTIVITPPVPVNSSSTWSHTSLSGGTWTFYAATGALLDGFLALAGGGSILLNNWGPAATQVIVTLAAFTSSPTTPAAPLPLPTGLSLSVGGATLTSAAPSATLPIFATPAAPVISQVGTPGTSHFSYKIVARGVGVDSVASATGSTTTTSNTINATNRNLITITPVAGATSYDVYRVADDQFKGPGVIGNTAGLTFADTGQNATIPGSAPTAPAIQLGASTGDLSDVWVMLNPPPTPIAIDCIWESGLARGSELSASMIRLSAFDVWVRGAGPLSNTVYGPDKVLSQTPQLLLASGVPATALAVNPGIMYALKLDFRQIENFSIRYETNTLDAWFELSGFRAYMKSDLYNR